MRKYLPLVLLVAIAATLVNDGGHYLRAQYELSTLTRDIATASAATARGNQDRTASWRTGEDIAKPAGATVYGYDVNERAVRVWTRMPVSGLWVLDRAAAVLASEPATTPLTVESDASAPIY